MEELKNKNLFKIMWLPGNESIVFDMKDEFEMSRDSVIYSRILLHFDLDQWAEDFEVHYDAWLEKDSLAIHDLNHSIHNRILQALNKMNSETEINDIVFYWYDRDRTELRENIPWTKSPVSGDDLINLGPDYFHLNRLVSLKDFLTFPDYMRQEVM